MRNVETWEQRERPRIIKQFPPRIQRDLNSIKTPPKELKLFSKSKDSFFIQGPAGTGKTILAAYMLLEEAKLRYLEAKEEDLYFLSTVELFENLRRNFNRPYHEQEDYVDGIRNAEFVVFDDLGAERPTDWVLSTLYLILNTRYEELRRTIFTSNFSLEDLAERFDDDRIPSRIDRMCETITLKKQYT